MSRLTKLVLRFDDGASSRNTKGDVFIKNCLRLLKAVETSALTDLIFMSFNVHRNFVPSVKFQRGAVAQLDPFFAGGGSFFLF